MIRMNMLNSKHFVQIKGRLAGFFLWLDKLFFAICCFVIMTTTGCEQQKTFIPGELAFNQAKYAQAEGLSVKATELYKQSASLGYLPAVDALLAMQQPRDSSVELRSWLLSLPPSVQPKLITYYQRLGTKLPALALDEQVELVANTAKQPCALTIQPVVSTELDSRQWLNLMQSWQQDEFLRTLAVCFGATLRVDAEALNCSDAPDRRLQCDLSVLQPLVKQGRFNQLLILSGRGAANFNNGVLQLPTYADIQLLKHEFSHVLGFIDEYALLPAVAKAECLPGRITPNLLFSQSDLSTYLQHWQFAQTDIELVAVDTCSQSNKQAYKVVAKTTHLQHYEMAIPELYQILMQKQLMRAHEIMPVQYYFAYLARQQANWPLWQEQMEKAAAFGYPPAQQALAEWHSRQSSLTAR